LVAIQTAYSLLVANYNKKGEDRAQPFFLQHQPIGTLRMATGKKTKGYLISTTTSKTVKD
jgi:hypothetical protein